MIEVVYHGPAGVHRAFDAQGVEYRLPRGVPTLAPEDLAAKLCEREHFAYADEVPPEVEPTETPDDPPVTDEHELPDPRGVNAESPYVEE